MIQIIKNAMIATREINTLVQDVSKEAQKTVTLVKSNGYALDKIKK